MDLWVPELYSLSVPDSREWDVIHWLLCCDTVPLPLETRDELMPNSGESGFYRALLMSAECTVVQLTEATSTDAHYLHKALNERHRFDVVTHLINCHKFDPQYQDSDGNNLLHIACIIMTVWERCFYQEAGRLKKVNVIEYAGSKLKGVIEYAIKKCHCDPQIKNCKGALPLHIACCSELVSLEVVELLSSCDVNIGLSSTLKYNNNITLVEGDTPLHAACLNESEEIVKYLIEKCHCDPRITNSKGALALHAACVGRSLMIVRLVSNCDVNTALTSTCPWNWTQTVEGDTPLHIACRQKVDVIVKYLIEECHCDPQIKNCKGALALHVACAVGSLNIVRLVSNCNVNTGLSCEWDFNMSMKLVPGDTPLHIACLNESEEIVKYLIEKCHCDPRVTNSKGALALHAACARRLPTIVRLVSSCDVNTGLSTSLEFDWKTELRLVQGDTPLHIACLRDSMEIVRYLIEECPCDPKIGNSNGVLPLHFACANCSLNIVKLVSDCDVNSTVTRQFEHTSYHTVGGRKIRMIRTGDTALHIIAKFWQERYKECEDLMEYLIKEKHCKVWQPHHEGDVIINYLLKDYCDEMSYDIGYDKDDGVVYLKGNRDKMCLHALKYIVSCLRDNQDEDGNTILHIACRPCVDVSQQSVVVKCLIQQENCHPRVLNKDGELPLHIACSQQSLEVVRLISNCDVSSKTKATGDTPLHIACKYSTVEVVKYLIEQCRCDPTAVNNAGKPCFFCALVHGQLDIAKYLIAHIDPTPEKGRSINGIRTCNGELAIHIACRQSSLDVVEYISEYTSDVNATVHSTGDTPLHIACREHTTRFVKYLIEEKHCNPNIPNNNRELPMHIACRDQATTIATLVSNCDVDFQTKLGNTPLHEACGASKAFSFPKKSMEIIRHLVSHQKCKVNVRNNEGKTAIHYACKAQSVELVNYLLLNGKADLSLADNEGQTPLMFTTNPALINVLLHHGADPKPLYKLFAQYFRDHSSENPPPTPQKILVVGNAGAGKTSLIQSLESEGGKNKGSNEPHPTAGIIPTNFQSDIYGPVIWYDFAGQREYYASHEAILHNLIAFSSPVVLLVVDIRKNEANIRHHLLYWLAFIAKCISAQDKPHLIVIGSHADIVMKEGIDPNLKLQKVLRNITERFESLRIKLVGRIPMDCRESRSPGITELQERLKCSSSQLRTDTVVGFNCHCFYIFLLDRFKSKPAVTVQQIISAIGEVTIEEDTEDLDYAFSTTDSESVSSLGSDDNESASDIDYQVNDIMKLLPDKSETIYQFCEDLNDRGHIILVKDPHQYEHSWVILNKEEILSCVNGTVFAPLEFTEHKILASSTGVVPFPQLKIHFSNFNPNMLVEFLSQLEFCREIEDQEILKLIYNVAESDNLERYFFFPGLVSISTPEGVWRPNECFNYKCGFILHCSEANVFFTPRFLQVLILRLAFSFALVPCTRSSSPAIERRCRVWKNGISWIDENGIEIVIEFLEDFQAVIIMLRCITGEENEVKCMFHRSSVIQAVLSTRKEICPQVSTTEFFVHPSSVEYPLKVNEGIALFSLAAVARAVANAKPCVVSDCGKNKDFELLKVEDLLCFEPYSDSGKEVLEDMFKDDNCKKEISDDFIFCITDSIAHRAQEILKKKWFIKMLKLPLVQLQEQTSRVPEGPTRDLIGLFLTWRQCTAGTYQCLRETFDKFSVFCGRNPLEVEAAQSQPDGTVHEKFLVKAVPSDVTRQQEARDDPVYGERPSMMDLQCLRWRNGDKEERLRLMDLLAPNWRDVGIALGLGLQLDSIEEECLRKPK